MALYLAGEKINFISGNVVCKTRTLTIEDYEKSVLGVGKLGFIKLEGYYMAPCTTAILGVGELGQMIIGNGGVV